MSEQRPSWIKKNFWGVITLVVVALGSMAVVKLFKKPGQMSVIEANIMDMSSMKPPQGALPVAMEAATRQVVEGTITYTGTVQAYEDEDVYPRITGRIVKMPVYPGDRVRKDQLLVKLDSSDSEYAARLDQAEHLGDSKMHEAQMARQDFEEAKFTLEARQQGENAARKAVDEARAAYDYWVPEIKRQEALLKDDVVSKEEYDAEKAKFEAASARLERARAQLSQATSEKLAAKAAFDKAIHHVSHESSASQEARAAQKTATIINRYREIKALKNGVVTKRLISPGVVVEPGMLILKVAHIDRVRVQAEVSDMDIDRVRTGDPVYISRHKAADEVMRARVTSIFPAADSRSRTSVVEALIDNIRVDEKSSRQVDSADQYRYLPGQYVIMSIVTGKTSGLTVPTEAVFYREGSPFVWVAEGAGGGPKKSRLVAVKTGLANTRLTEIRDGLKEGDLVVTRGYADMQPEMQVVAVKWTEKGIEQLPKADQVASNRLSESNKWRLEKKADQYALTIALTPVPPEGGRNKIEITVTGDDGVPVDGASITGRTSMPGMDMKGPDLKSSGSGGHYAMKADFSGGLWSIDLEIRAPGRDPCHLTVEAEVP
ncbi:MAG: efflux RND transporter periplasmic adaptor subunit [Candidatus Obscuribacterales bacterium]